jgi:trehalose-6-phosphate synthase
MVRKVTMIQVAVPSREGVPEYRALATRMHQRVDEINAKYGAFRCLRPSFYITQPILTHHSTGTPSYQPINLLHQSVSFEDLLALYASSDVCLITSIRDGMNLVSYEYIACQKDRRGVLMLSEFAGASERLAGSLLFNPWDKAGTADAIYRALTMDMGERAANHQKAEEFVMRNTRYGAYEMNYPSTFHKLTCDDRSARWAETFVAELSSLGVRS